MRRALGFLVLALSTGLAWSAEPTLAERQAQAKKQQAGLRAQIQALQKEIDSHESSRRDAARELKASESAISAINLQLSELEARQRKAAAAMKALETRIGEQAHELRRRQNELAEQLRAQYAGGLSPWAALLSGDDPNAIGRDLSYLGYISRAQADAVRHVRQALDDLAASRARAKVVAQELASLASETAEQKEALEQQKAEREKVLARVDALLAEQRKQAGRLEENDERLGNLVGGLEKAIARQAEEARIAEEKRRAAAALKAKQARAEAEAARKRADAERKRIEAAREQTQAAGEQAEVERKQAEIERERSDAERERGQPERGQPEGAESEEEARRGEPDAASTAKLAPAGGFTGLKKGMPFPVRGEVLGRFGAERPEGGLWRGIVLRSPEGARVHAIAPGRVVYSGWLSGFGNLLILDHGAKYLSVYAYNQSLLKRVGDIVDTGDTVATVGATGGQVDSGLYFEIRHQGTPVNPLLWIRQ
ncbi:MAG TPA: peptidoglycan DD-metalloendopeptidase family protein [Candidimonas sp.]|nr:peptidoglycan DD-metalloendopeptidase family protein [Candidimonas sp.]